MHSLGPEAKKQKTHGPVDAFAEMRRASKAQATPAPNVIGIGYEAQLCGDGVDPDDFLYGTCYYGIAVRGGFKTPEALLKTRRREHQRDSVNDPKELGFRAALAWYGFDAFVWRVVVYKTDADAPTTQAWANAWEISAIAAAGGMLRDMEPDEPLRQTFNLTNGGQSGNPRDIWAGIEARCTKKWKAFWSHLRAYVDEHGTARVPHRHVADDGYRLGQSVTRVRGGQMIRGRPNEAERRAWLEALPGWSWNTLDDAWETFQWYLLAYVEEFGTACVPAQYVTDDGYLLGERVHNVRSKDHYLKGKHEAERRAWLESRPGWTWSVLDDTWETFQQHLLEYVEEFGTARVPQDVVMEDGYRLGVQVHHIRNQDQFLRGRDEAERRAWLESQPGWSWKPWDDAWETFQRYLLEYVEEFGTACVPRGVVTKGGYNLGVHVNSIRTVNQFLRGKDEAKRRAWLGSQPGWSWNPWDDAWETFQQHLLAYVEEFGTACVPTDVVTKDGYNLGIQVSNIRSNDLFLKDKSNGAERRAWLKSQPGWSWNVLDDAWRAFQQHLLAYIEEFGTACVPQDVVTDDGYPLGIRVNSIRSLNQFLKGKDKAKRRAWLDSQPGWSWSILDDAWNDFQQHLEAHVDATGTSFVSQKFVSPDGYNLGARIPEIRFNDQFLRGKPDEAERRAFLERQPEWAWKVSISESRKHTAADLKLFRATTHPDATRADLKHLRNDGTLLYRAHAVMRAATRSVVDDLITTLEM